MNSNDTGYDAPPSNNHIKAIGTVFALVIAPIIAGIVANVGSFVVQKKLEGPAETPAPAATAAPQPAAPAQPATQPVALVASVPRAPVVPTQKQGPAANPAFQQGLDTLHALPANHLFNGRDLAGFYTYIGPKEPEGKPVGKNHDPDQVFTVKNGVLAISGKEMGSLTTSDEYENYLLTLEYRWGSRTYKPRNGLPKFGAIGFHTFGADGGWKGFWKRGYRVRLDENGGGDLAILPNTTVDPHVSMEVEAHQVTTGKNTERTNYTYTPGGSVREVGPASHIFRFGTVNSTSRYTPGAPAGTVYEKPPGEWNTMDILSIGDTFGIILNGTLVSAGSKASRTRGAIQLTPDRADIFFRTVDLRSVPRSFPTLAGMPKPSAHSSIAKVTEKKPGPGTEKKPSSATDGAPPSKNKAQARPVRTPKKKTDGRG